MAVQGVQNGTKATGVVTLERGVHRWTFTCDREGGRALARRLAELADTDGYPLDRFDAALVCHQLDREFGAAPQGGGPRS
jgi:hypothetical protein